MTDGRAYRLRPASAADAEALALVGAATFLETFAGIIGGADIAAHVAAKHSVQSYRQALDEPGTTLVLAEARKGGAPVGYVYAGAPGLPIETGDEDYEIRRIYALGRYHGSGIGGDLMDAAFDAAKSMGKRRALLGVYSGNTRAIGFYGKMGFVLAGERTFEVGMARFHDVIMAREL